MVGVGDVVRRLARPRSVRASKMGVLGLSKVASKEAGRRYVRGNVVAPGRTDTPLLRSRAFGDSPQDAAALVTPIPLGRFAEPIELAQATDLLAVLTAPVKPKPLSAGHFIFTAAGPSPRPAVHSLTGYRLYRSTVHAGLR
jgi:NAD(P)-dependent dehydrogenase (short-subunit alcohol dehydrogenase family)